MSSTAFPSAGEHRYLIWLLIAPLAIIILVPIILLVLNSFREISIGEISFGFSGLRMEQCRYEAG